MEEVVEKQSLENYELMLIFLSDLGEDGINKELDEFKKHISSDGGEIFNEDIWGNREMSYRIKKQNQGFYCVLNFKISPEHIAEMQKNLTISPAVIRFLLTKTPVNYVFKTFEEYKALAEKEKELKEEATKQLSATPGKQKSVEKPGVEKKAPVKAQQVEIKEVKPAIKEVPKTVEKKPRKITGTDSGKTKLEEVDAKLKSIIDNPDITL